MDIHTWTYRLECKYFASLWCQICFLLRLHHLLVVSHRNKWNTFSGNSDFKIMKFHFGFVVRVESYNTPWVSNGVRCKKREKKLNRFSTHPATFNNWRISLVPCVRSMSKTELGCLGSTGFKCYGIPSRYYLSSIWKRWPITGLVGKSASKWAVGLHTGWIIPRRIASLWKCERTSAWPTPFLIMGELANVNAAWLSFNWVI